MIIDNFNSDFFSDYLVYPDEATSSAGVLLKDVCSNITQIMFTDETSGNDGTTLTYYFQSNYYNKDNVNYKTYNYEELRKIKIPEEIVNN